MSTEQPRLLVVDDDPGIVDYLLDMLRQENYSAAGYTGTAEALEAIAAEPFDLVILVGTLSRRISAGLGKTLPVNISAEVLRWIRAYHWPGNVRELANTLERAIALTEHDTLLLEDLAQASAAAGERGLPAKCAGSRLDAGGCRARLHAPCARRDRRQ